MTNLKQHQGSKSSHPLELQDTQTPVNETHLATTRGAIQSYETQVEPHTSYQFRERGNTA
jgi:hypothetical protein